MVLIAKGVSSWLPTADRDGPPGRGRACTAFGSPPSMCERPIHGAAFSPSFVSHRLDGCQPAAGRQKSGTHIES